MVPLHEGLQQDVEIENVKGHSLSISFRVSLNLNKPTMGKSVEDLVVTITNALVVWQDLVL